MAGINPEELKVPFNQAEMDEGRQLLDDGDVRLLEGSGDGSWEARVRFFRRHHNVWIERDQGGAVSHECSCPWLENQGTGCAHLWALLLRIEVEEKEAAFGEDGPPPIHPAYLIEPHPKKLLLGIWWSGDEEEGALRPLPPDGDHLGRVEDPAHLAAIKALEPIAGGRRNRLDGGGFVDQGAPWKLGPEERLAVLEAASRTGALGLRQTDGPPTPLTLDTEAPFELVLGFATAGDGDAMNLGGWLVRGDERHAVSACGALAPDRSPVAALDGRIIAIQAYGAEEWLSLLSRDRAFPVDESEGLDVLKRLADAGPLPRVALTPDAPPVPLDRQSPTPHAAIARQRQQLVLDLEFSYGDVRLPMESGQRLVLDLESGVQRRRDTDAEARVAALLDQEDGLTTDEGVHGRWFVDPSGLTSVVATLLEHGFEVTAEDRRYRKGNTPAIELSSGVDWFELSGGASYGDGCSVDVEQLMRSWRDGRKFVELDDGSLGLVPTEWLARIGGVLQLGQSDQGAIRFHRAQAPLLEPLAEETGGVPPELMSGLLSQLKALSDPAPYGTLPAINGELRPYQSAGVSWLRELAAANLGGCLADDMGLGKTVQAIAFLESLQTDPAAGTPPGPTLIIAPRSLLWNWSQETRRFAPRRELLVHHGASRHRGPLDVGPSDWMITTYGTLQRDIEQFQAVEWSVVILDEAQAIKNPRSKNAGAVRQLRARVRLALTGTPVENHARDLWSLMEFLNPGLLGSERRFLERTSRRADSDTRALLARTIAPLVLRRTKQEVAPELPERIEQTVLVPLTDEQRQLYEAIRTEAARTVVDRDGDGRRPLHVLEALLRLRQVACHPALVDQAMSESGKVELLTTELEQLVLSGHKALVFSQFVKLLDLVAARLEAAEIPFTRLDGSTRDREAVVRRFQEDDACPVMLVSLKAGGHGLNLTAADYVFLLDPWWNPAVEAQAIDRAHRIGRRDKVIAYRLVAKDTVEERILELQQTKREVAEALIEDARGPLADLTEADLRLLLS